MEPLQETKAETQAERFAQKFAEIKIEITTDDRKAAKNETGLTPETISRYINGTINDLDTAAALLMLFRKRIAEREKVIS